MAGFMRGQNCQQRSGKLQSLTQEFWVSEGVTNYLYDCRHINPGDEENGSGEAPESRRRDRRPQLRASDDYAEYRGGYEG